CEIVGSTMRRSFTASCLGQVFGDPARVSLPGGVGRGVEIFADRLTIEREKGFEPSTSTLAREFRTRDLRGFERLWCRTVRLGAGRWCEVVTSGSWRSAAMVVARYDGTGSHV